MSETVNSTKQAAESILTKLPSVVGAFVREDIRGNPRDVHLLVKPGPRPRELAYDVRDLLEEHLGVGIDQRVISIAQISSSASERIKESYRQRLTSDTMENESPSAHASSAPPPPSAPTPSTPVPPPTSAPQPARPKTNGAHTPASNGHSPVPTAKPSHAGTREVTHEGIREESPAGFDERRPEGGGSNAMPWPRLIFKGVDTATRESEVRVRVRLEYAGEVFRGEAVEMDAGGGRARAAASATLEAVRKACGEARFDAEVVSMIPALGRQYVLVGVLALSSATGRRPLDLAGAHPAGDGIELAAAYAALKATNRFVGLVLANRDA